MNNISLALKIKVPLLKRSTIVYVYVLYIMYIVQFLKQEMENRQLFYWKHCATLNYLENTSKN